MSRTHRYAQHGVALLSAIFLLVVLAALALYMTSLSGTQHFTAMWAAQGARAHYAASSGVQWGMAQALDGGGCDATITVDAGGAQPFAVTVSCAPTSFEEGGATRTLWTIVAQAQAGGALGSPGYVQRTQRATVVGP